MLTFKISEKTINFVKVITVRNPFSVLYMEPPIYISVGLHRLAFCIDMYRVHARWKNETSSTHYLQPVAGWNPFSLTCLLIMWQRHI